MGSSFGCIGVGVSISISMYASGCGGSSLSSKLTAARAAMRWARAVSAGCMMKMEGGFAASRLRDRKQGDGNLAVKGSESAGR